MQGKAWHGADDLCAVQTQLISQGGYTWVPQLQSVTATTQAPPSKGYLIVANKCSHK